MGEWQVPGAREVEVEQVQNALHTTLGLSALRKPRSYPGSYPANFMDDASGSRWTAFLPTIATRIVAEITAAYTLVFLLLPSYFYSGLDLG